MAYIFDSHAHYDDEQFDEDRDDLLEELKQKGVGGILNMSSDYASIKRTVDLTKKYDFIYGAIGIHPENADEYSEAVKEEILALLKEEKMKAIGEVGLDYYWESNPPKELQLKVLRDQYEIARSLGLPVILHDREAHEDILRMAKEYRDVTSVFHSYSGSVEMAREFIKLGFMISLGGPVTFKKSKTPKLVAYEIPLEHLLIETDSPYLTPEPFRGKRNEPSYVKLVAEEIAGIRSISVDEVAEQTSRNFKRLFKLL